MKISIALTFAALLLALAPASSFAGDDGKNTTQTHVASTNQQVSIKLLRLRIRAPQTPAIPLGIN